MRFARLVVPDVRRLLTSNPDELSEVLAEFHHVDLAELLTQLEPAEAAGVVRLLPEADRAQIFEHIDEEQQVSIVEAMPRPEAADLLGDMSADDRVDLMADLREETQVEILPFLGAEEAKEVRQLAAYAEHTAGSLMTTEFMAFNEDMTTDEAIAHVRAVGEQKETIYYGYVLGSERILVGVVSLALLVKAKPTEKLSALMETHVIEVRAEADQEDVAQLIRKYDLLALPVVDGMRRMVGIITVDDILDVASDEATEDIHRLGAVAPMEEPYLRTGFWSLFRKRAPWLVVIFVGEMLTGTALKSYEDTFAKIPDLVLFLPLLISSGGNSGAQSSTLVIRAMALGEVEFGAWWAVCWRELRMGFALGLILGFVGFFRAWWLAESAAVWWTVSIALLGIVLWGCIVGAVLPLMLRAVRIDPALASGPFVATLVDVTGILLYFGVAVSVIPGLST